METRQTYQHAIKSLLEEAESRFHADMEKRTASTNPPHIPSHLAGLDLTINEEALIALSAAFAKSGAFDNEQTRTALQDNISTITTPLIQAWIEEHLPNIAREVIRESLDKVSKVRPTTLRASLDDKSLPEQNQPILK